MTLTVDLTPEAAQRLAELAAREGRESTELAADLLGESLEANFDELEVWLRNPVSATLAKIDAGNGEFFTVEEVGDAMAARRAGA